MKQIFKTLAAGLLALVALVSVSGCSSQELLDMSQFSAVIDVRTPEETAQGYLEGALLFDIQDGNFMSQLETLDKSANYFVYCRSGNRAGQAIEIMKQSGFTGELVNGGSLANASGLTGLEVIQ